MFGYFRSRLPGFSHVNWTSEMCEFAGYPAFEGVSHSDFWYHDAQGVLTRELFPDTPSFHGATPEYFIEVKSTSGTQNDRFFMRGPHFRQVRSRLVFSERY